MENLVHHFIYAQLCSCVSLLLFRTYKGIWERGKGKKQAEIYPSRTCMLCLDRELQPSHGVRFPPGLRQGLSPSLFQSYPCPQPPPTVWGLEAGISRLTFLIGVVVKGPSVEDTPALLPL